MNLRLTWGRPCGMSGRLACGSSTARIQALMPSMLTPVPPAPAGPTLQSIEFRHRRERHARRCRRDESDARLRGIFRWGAGRRSRRRTPVGTRTTMFVQTINNEEELTTRNSGSATITPTCQGVFARGS